MTKNCNEFKEWENIQNFRKLSAKDMPISKKKYLKKNNNRMFEDIMDAIIKCPDDSKNVQFWMDIYRFRQKYYEPQEENEWWDAFMSDMTDLCKKWSSSLSISICGILMKELEDYERMQNNIITSDEYKKLYGNMREEELNE